MKKILISLLIGMMVLGLTIPMGGMIASSASSSEDPQGDGFEDLTIETDPAVPPSGELEPESDKNINVNLTTESTRMDEAYLNVSAIKWNGKPVKGLDPSNPGTWVFEISENGYHATSLLNNLKYFDPGTKVTWNVYVVNYTQHLKYASQNYSYEVKGAWHYNNSYEDTFYRNLEMDMSPELPPNAYDPVTITLQSRYDDVEIGQAMLDLRYEKNESIKDNGTMLFRNIDPVEGIEQVTIPGLPAGTRVDFSIRAWDHPDDDTREIESEKFNYTVSWGNTWDFRSFEENIELTTDPEGVGDSVTETSVDIGESVNITIESKDSEVPIKTAVLEYKVGGEGIKTQEGQDVFTKITSTKWYYEIDGQPPGIEIEFQVRAYDIMRDDIVSPKYNYDVSRVPKETPEEVTFFYVTVFDGDANEYVGGANITIKNETWIWEGKTNGAGFAYPTEMNSLQPRYLHYGTYNITVEYQGATKNIKYDLTPEGDETVEVEFNPSEEEDPMYAESIEMPPYYLMGLVITAGLSGIVAFLVYKFRKGKNEDEGLAVGG
ncbi:MAG: hypothetical protein V5A88_06205 [Candidatus Thermoplasmatota archaeon]